MRHWHSRSRAISSIIGAAMLILIFIAFVAFVFISMQRIERLTELSTEIITSRSEASGLASYVDASGVYNPFRDTLTIYITSSYPRTLLVTSLNLVFASDDYIGDYITISQNVITSSPALSSVTYSITVTTPSGTTYSLNSFPIALGPGYQATITLNNIPTTPESATITLSASPTIAVMHIKIIEQRPTQPTNISLIKVPQTAYLNTLTSSGTVTWLGTVRTIALENRTGYVANVNVYQGTYTGNTTHINATDGLGIPISSTRVKQDIQLFQKNHIVANDFTNLQTVAKDNYVQWIKSKDSVAARILLSTHATGYTAITNFTYGYAYYRNYRINDLFEGHRHIYMVSRVRQYGFIKLDLRAFINSGSSNGSTIGGLIPSFNTTWGSGYGTAMKSFDNVTILLFSYIIDRGLWLGFINTSSYIPQILEGKTISGRQFNVLFSVLLKVDIIKQLNNGFQATFTAYYYNISSENFIWNGTSESIVTYGLPALYVYGGIVTEWYVGEVLTLVNMTYNFSDTVLSYANPMWVNVTDVPSGWCVKLLSGNEEVSKGEADRNRVVSLFVLHDPVVENAVFRIYNVPCNQVTPENEEEVTVYNKSFSMVVGGDVYTYIHGYGFSMDVSSVVNTSSFDARKLYIPISLMLNSSADIYLYVYNWSSQSFDLVKHNVSSAVSDVVVLDSFQDYVNSVNGTVRLRLVIRSDNPFSGVIDCLNAVLEGYAKGVRVEALLVGVGGTDTIYIYRLPLANGTINRPIINATSIRVFDGYTDIAYDMYSDRLYSVNGSGIYWMYLNGSNAWSYLGSYCRALGPGTRLEVLHSGSSSYIAVLQGDGTLCVVSTDGAPIYNGSITIDGVVYSYTRYVVSAAYGDTLYFTAINSEEGYPVIVAYRVSRNTTYEVARIPGIDAVGLAYGNNSLWLMLEYGAVYRIDPATGTVTPLSSVMLPFYPVGYGDRLEYYNGYLLFVRASNTTEVWLIPTS